MHNKGKVIQILLFLSYCISSIAIGRNIEIIELTAGLSKPPFVIENNKLYSGIQLDLITEIFAIENQPISFIHVPLARSFSSVSKWHTDGKITLPSTHKQKNVFISAPSKIHRLFASRVYSAGFKSKAIRDQFNRGLAVIKANGKYQKELDKYLL